MWPKIQALPLRFLLVPQMMSLRKRKQQTNNYNAAAIGDLGELEFCSNLLKISWPTLIGHHTPLGPQVCRNPLQSFADIQPPWYLSRWSPTLCIHIFVFREVSVLDGNEPLSRTNNTLKLTVGETALSHFFWGCWWPVPGHWVLSFQIFPCE